MIAKEEVNIWPPTIELAIPCPDLCQSLNPPKVSDQVEIDVVRLLRHNSCRQSTPASPLYWVYEPARVTVPIAHVCVKI